MKKTILSVCLAVTCGMLSSCGGLGTLGSAVAGNIINGGNNTESAAASTASAATSALTGGNLIGNLISTFAGGVLTNQSSLIGTWTYTQPCVQFESQSLLSQAGGAVAANTVEQKLATYYNMAGIKPGSFTFAFDKDGGFQYTIGNRTAKGTYTFDSSKKTVTLKTQAGISITAYVSISVNQMGLTFDATKLLTLMTAVSAQSSQLSTLSSLAGSFKGMKLGFEFKK